MSRPNTPLVLVILDGWGLNEKKEGNAIARAETPNMDQLMRDFPNTTLSGSGEDVGLPEGQMGNSEVGHMNMGAGRVVYQDLTRISHSIKNGDFYSNGELHEAVKNVKENNSSMHFMGLLSDGGVHSHIEHLFALLEFARDQGVKNVFVHAFLDGRDVPPKNALEYIKALEEKTKDIETGEIATISGRYYAMDRDKRWDRTEKAYRAIAAGEGVTACTAAEAVNNAYSRGETDEFVEPAVVTGDGGKPVGKIENGDSIIFFNFRPDRARQITRALVDKDFKGFQRPENPRVHFCCMTEYDREIDAPVAFEPPVLVNTLGEVLSYHGLKQLRLSETEKYAHVTFFFNGGVEKPNPGEDREIVPSPKVKTYDRQPEMSACEVTEVFKKKLNEDKYDVVIMNYANPDMVGHTGVLEAAVKAVETVDSCLGKIVNAVIDRGGTLLVTADHGNAEVMIDEFGECHTAHTTAPVPFVCVKPGNNVKLSPGRLEDIAPTMLSLLDVEKPEEMTGRTLLK